MYVCVCVCVKGREGYNCAIGARSMPTARERRARVEG